MTNNNYQRLNIWLSQQDKFSYKEFAIKCIEQNITPLSISEFAQKVGMISVAMVEYPDKKPEEAYMELIKRMNNEYDKQTNNQPNNQVRQPNKSGCSGCNKQISDGGKII